MAQFIDGSGFNKDDLLSENKRIDTNSYPKEDRREFPKEALDVLDAFEIASLNSRREPYETWKENGEEFIQTPAGIPQTLKGYTFQLEKSAIALSRKNKHLENRYDTVSIWKYLYYRFHLFKSNFWFRSNLK